MRLETCIPPRKDGTVKVHIDGDDISYVFKPDELGVMVAEVENEAHIAFLISLGDDFLPADEADFETANALISAPPDEDAADDVEDEADDDIVDQNAAPIEEPASVVAAPAPRKAATQRKAAAKKATKAAEGQ